MHRDGLRVRRISLSVFTALSLAGGISCGGSAPATITQEEADGIAERYREARNTTNLDLLDAIYDPEVVVHDCSAPEDIHGLDALKRYYAESHAGFPDFRIEFEKPIVAGDTVVFRWTIEGTHSGPLRGLPATGSRVRFSGVAIDRVLDGRIVEEWVDFNVLDLMLQLGFRLEPPAAGPG